MPHLSWNEARDRAIKFSRDWSDATREAADKQTFWNEFFNVFGRNRRTVASFEVAVRNLGDEFSFIDLLWKGMLLVEHKSAGKSLEAAESQAFEYIASLAREGRDDEIPRYVVLSDFKRFALFDLEPEEQQDLPIFAGLNFSVIHFPLEELHRHVRPFAFIKGEKTVRLDPEDPANEKAYGKMCQLHDGLRECGFTGTELERFLVRILFCLFAEDTGIFDPNAFQSFIRNQTREDGSDLGSRLNQLFEVLNTAQERRPPSLEEEIAQFPYVNGELFKERLCFPPFSQKLRSALLKASDFQWAKVSPAVFGSLFQGILEPTERRQQGAHYTSERDIMKVVRSLFLDDLRVEFETIRSDRSKRRLGRLDEFHNKLRTLKFFDPACGCGNFLVLSYRELRLLELEVLLERHAGDKQSFTSVDRLILVDVDQFYGIEISEWPVRIAEVAMWLMDHQMNQRVSEAFGQTFFRLPLRHTPHIVHGNALRIDWRTVLPPTDGLFVLGNPPFVGKHLMTEQQGQDVEAVWGKTGSVGVLDYVTAWYRKAAEYIAGSQTPVAFVSTNSITQGEQPGVLWPELFGRWQIKIHFAHRTFAWESESRGAAHVHVVIIGFGAFDTTRKRVYDYEQGEGQVTVTEVRNISPYLFEGIDLALPSRTDPIANVPPCIYGSKPVDGGHLIVEESDRISFLKENPAAKSLLRPLLCNSEYLYGIPRWCLWLVDVPPNQYRTIAGVRKRIEAVREFRLTSKKAPTRQKADAPGLFAEIRQPTSRFIVIPLHTSELRRYVPWGYFSSKHIIHNSCSAIPDATPYHFGVISSLMHMAWIRTVCGRIKSDFRYSTNIVYNNYPWPASVNEKWKSAVEKAAQGVLDARKPFLPPKGDSTLADLYDPLTMPAPLAKAHAELDRAVDRCYRAEPFRSDRERVEHLFALYEKLTAPILPAMEERTPRKKSTACNATNPRKPQKKKGT